MSARSPSRRGAGATLAGLVVEHVWDVLRGPSFRFVAATAAAFVVFFARAPGAWVNPVFFAEDRDWTTLLVTHGFWHTVFHARPDYAVLGNVAVLWVGMRLCDLVGGDPLTIPRYQAVVSYLVFAIVVSLPLALLRRRLRPEALAAVWLLALAMPLGIHSGTWSGYEILGRATNVGFAALFVAFLLVWVRLTTDLRPVRTVAIDAGLTACVLTNPIATALLPVAAWPALRPLLRCRDRAGLRTAIAGIAGDPAMWSLVAATLFCLTGTGLPTLPGHDPRTAVVALKPFDWAVECGLARSLLYSLSWPIYRWLNTDRTVALAALALWLTWRFGLPRHRWLYAGGLALLALTSATLVFKRPEAANHLGGYRTTFPDRYFYAQYLIGLPLIAAFASDLQTRLAARPFLARLPLAALFALAALAVVREPPGKIADSQFIVDDDGCFSRSAARAVALGAWRGADGKPAADGAFVGIPAHPSMPKEVLLPRAAVERAIIAVGASRTTPVLTAAAPAASPPR
jgi:hypothetical protein